MSYVIDAVNKVKAAVNKVLLGYQVTGDTQDRFVIDASGKQEWGSGSAGLDTNLYRGGASVLQTDDTLKAAGFKIGDNFVGGIKIAKIALTATELGGVETNTSFTYPASGALQLYAWIEVTDAESGTIDVGTQGTSNDPDGILDGISVATLGTIVPAAVTTTGLNETYISSMTFGALSHTAFVGADEAGEKGSVVWTPRFITAADPVSVTSSGDLNSCTANLYLVYIDLAQLA
jgi:hypothetical protein